MNKQRQIKVLSIVALVIAVIGMSLGFAAFSTTLSISSSATVTPNSENFNIVAYGITEDTFRSELSKPSQNYNNPLLYTSTTESVPILIDAFFAIPQSASTSYISVSKNEIIIDNIFVEIQSKTAGAIYMWKIQNEGQYDAYLNIESVGEISCSSQEEMTSTMSSVCGNIERNIQFLSSSGESIDPTSYVLSTDDYMFITLILSYNQSASEWPDGNVEVTFEDLLISFSTAPYMN